MFIYDIISTCDVVSIALCMTSLTHHLLIMYFSSNHTWLLSVLDFENSSNKENIPPYSGDDETFDFENSSFKYDNEYSSDEEYIYSSEDDVELDCDDSHSKDESNNSDCDAQIDCNNDNDESNKGMHICIYIYKWNNMYTHIVKLTNE